jgi:hypothetical protein
MTTLEKLKERYYAFVEAKTGLRAFGVITTMVLYLVDLEIQRSKQRK